jgi:hypothetical protein
LAAKGCVLDEQVFITTEKNEAGIYALRFFLNGKVRVVVVDDYLPMDKRKNRPAFAHSKS